MRRDYYDAGPAEQVGAVPKESATTTAGLFFVLLAGVMLAPLFPNQFISGPMVNALLIIITVMLGLRSAVILSFVPSIMALVSGLLPAMFAPFVPFIILSNIIFVCLFHWLRLHNYWLAAGAGSVAKFIFLFVMSQLLFNIFLNQTLAQAAAMMMSWNQLYSAALGSLIAYGFLKTIKRI
ncbi:MAG: iron hydrogenase [Patescibacteria group bacterium]